ncbi:MFS transporter [uncultured Helicobacter sp.]|uniref:MFS transporter n=1 Tax=uncultured Helicobacter sp. TaxID=175537 RepID=UPI00374E68E3
MFKDVFALTLVSSFRFFGLFVALPAIGLYTDAFGTSAFLAGIAAGGYAITQIIFQTPFGIWSDTYDKKRVIALGLVIFILGSLVCAFSNDIIMLIIGRFLQGAGAIGGVISAQIADLVREEDRSKAMAMMGAGIFVSFILAMILGPLIAGNIGLQAIFLLTALLNALALILLLVRVPPTPKITYTYNNTDFMNILKNPNLQVLNLSALLQKFLMIFTFVIVGMALRESFDITESSLWEIYAPGAILGLLVLAPASILAQKKGYFKQVLLTGIVAFILSYACIAYASAVGSLWLFVLGIMIFFVGFSIHEPIMQTLASRYPKAHQKGSALGFFTTLGFVGSALGALCSGMLYESLSLANLSINVVVVCVLWAIVMMIWLHNPNNEKNLYLPIDSYTQVRLENLNNVEGVIEWYINTTQGVVIIKYDDRIINQEAILAHLDTPRTNPLQEQ